MKHTCRISIITPAYKCEQTLSRTLDSLMAQSERSWESIVVDDGSPDRSWDVAEGFAYFDPRFVLFRQRNLGASIARNVGIKAARGQYVLFLDSDDWLEPDALRILADGCDEHGWAAAHGAFRYFTNDGMPTDWIGAYTGSRPLFEAMASSNVLAMPAAVLVRRSVLKAVGGFDPSFRNCGDWDLWARVARQSSPVGRVDACVAGYRMRPTSLSHNPHTLLRDAIRTMERIHQADKRVLDPHPDFAEGADPRDLNGRQANFTLYAIGLCLAANDRVSADRLLDGIGDWPSFSVTEAAGFLLSAISFAHCQPPGMASFYWEQVAEGVEHVLLRLERKTKVPQLRARVLGAMDGLSGGEISRAAPPIQRRMAV